jgi:hypothetical protein
MVNFFLQAAASVGRGRRALCVILSFSTLALREVSLKRSGRSEIRGWTLAEFRGAFQGSGTLHARRCLRSHNAMGENASGFAGPMAHIRFFGF